MWYLPKHFRYLSLLLLIGARFGHAQTIKPSWNKDSCSAYLDGNLKNKKVIPVVFDTQICLALLNYPELANEEIEFRVVSKHSPLSARPTFASVFKKRSKRKYLVFISNKTSNFLNPILLNNLSFNSQVGVLSHELSHVLEYKNKGFLFFVRLAFKNLFRPKAMDNFEFNTDGRSIEHGYGYQLLSWSREVRQKLLIKGWGGADNKKPKRERYMNPETILNYMNTLKIYKL